jgi:hypothetical protein
MTKAPDETKRLRGMRDVLVGQLALLDAIGEAQAAIELNSAIEILNGRIGEAPSAEEMARLQRRYFSD